MRGKMNRIKTIAIYLPQFHRLPENDAWWGEGFTEWTAVSSAEKLFPGHNQPREPFNDNYYDLMKKETMEWQADLAKRYGVYGFCFYHYYFKNGRKILEKPAENLLQWKDIDLPFCFCWANPTWARTWSKLTGANSWSEKFEGKQNRENGILLEQAYGKEREWEAHFQYLLPFFRDQRYIKIDCRPVFVIYMPDEIPVLHAMLSLWDELAVREGFSGIYSIAVDSLEHKDVSAALLLGPKPYQYANVIGEEVREELHGQIWGKNYESVWKNAVSCNVTGMNKIYYGGFVDYDDSPRRGIQGTFLVNANPDTFEKYLYELAVKNMALGNDLLFINAWNEWGEGNYLEPDKKNGYAYLEAVRRINKKCNDENFDEKAEWERIQNRIGNKETDGKEKILSQVKRYQKLFYLLDRWMLLKEKNIGLEDYFRVNHVSRIIIYGFAAVGKHVFEELKNTSVEVVCVLDRTKWKFEYPEIKILNPLDPIPDADLIIVTVMQRTEDIIEQLRKHTDQPVVSFYEVIFNIPLTGEK